MSARGLKLVALSLLLGGMTVLLSGCSWSEVLGLGWPNGITPEAHANRELWIGSVIAAFVGYMIPGLVLGHLVKKQKLKIENGLQADLFEGIQARHVMTPLVVCLREKETIGQAAEFKRGGNTGAIRIIKSFVTGSQSSENDGCL